MVVLGKGAREGVSECQHQFRKHRWNCSTLDRDASVFGKVLLKGKASHPIHDAEDDGDNDGSVGDDDDDGGMMMMMKTAMMMVHGCP